MTTTGVPQFVCRDCMTAEHNLAFTWLMRTCSLCQRERLCLYLADPVPAPPTRTEEPEIPLGAYVLATKYSDGDPGDAWALGFYAGCKDDRHYVKDSAGNNIRGNGYRRVRRIRGDVGHWLLKAAAKQLEMAPAGTVNLWSMLTDSAFDLSEERP